MLKIHSEPLQKLNELKIDSRQMETSRMIFFFGWLE